MPELHVPLALNEQGEIVSPSEAKKGQSYYCPACNSLLVFRQGAIKVAHFAHHANPDCNQETILHKTAKRLIRNVIVDWKAGRGAQPDLIRDCAICEEPIIQKMPDKVETAVEEYAFGGYVLDVALLGGGQVLAGIEVRVTHAVDDEKAEGLSLPFIEVDANVIIQNPLYLRPILDKFNPVICKKCKDLELELQSVRMKTQVSYDANFFRAAAIPCWKCKKEILVFTWADHHLFQARKPECDHMPHTIQERYSKTVAKKYWANTCPYCSAIQGDFFLYEEPDGPFFSGVRHTTTEDMISTMLGMYR